MISEHDAATTDCAQPETAVRSRDWRQILKGAQQEGPFDPMSGFEWKASRSKEMDFTLCGALVRMVTLIDAAPLWPGERCHGQQATG